MKKIIFLLTLSIITISCNSIDELLELKINNDLTESIDVHINQTNGTALSFNLTETANLNSGNFSQYVDKIKDLKINKLTYTFKEFSGNIAGVIQSGNLQIDNIILGTLTNFNISQAAKAGTIFEISDSNTLNQIKTNLLTNDKVTVKLAGSVLSDGSTMDFKVEVFMNMTATIKE